MNEKGLDSDNCTSKEVKNVPAVVGAQVLKALPPAVNAQTKSIEGLEKEGQKSDELCKLSRVVLARLGRH
jgi:hypothetical protein